MKHEDVSEIKQAAMASAADTSEPVQKEAENPRVTATAAIIEALRRLSNKIGETIIDGNREGLLRPTEEVYTRYPIDERSIEQTDYGVRRVNYAPEEFTKESWSHAARAVVWRLRDSDEYTAIVNMFDGTALDAEKGKRLLDSFAHRISYRFLETDVASQRVEFLSAQLEVVSQHLNGEQFRHSSEVRVVGLAAPPTVIELEAHGINVLLRRVTAEDLIEEQPEFARRDFFPPTPTAILRLSKVVQRENEIQRAVWQAITILRLFRVGSIRDISYTHETDSFFALGGTITSHQHYMVVTDSVIQDVDRERFEDFWNKLSEALPPEGYGRDQKRVEPIEIAYQRYSDALLFWGVTVERRVSDAVIGLESLFLLENDELSYRLRLRVARLLGTIGFDPHCVQDAMKRAYEVRSSFLHGDQVEARKLRKIDEQYGSLNNLLLQVLDHLRCAIVFLTLTKVTKAELIELLDSSFIDENASQKLAAMLTPLHTLLLPMEHETTAEA